MHDTQQIKFCEQEYCNTCKAKTLQVYNIENTAKWCLECDSITEALQTREGK